MPDSKQHSCAEDEVLVRVEGVSKKFCRSLKRSLWYGLCDIAGELNPFAKQGAGSREPKGLLKWRVTGSESRATTRSVEVKQQGAR